MRVVLANQTKNTPAKKWPTEVDQLTIFLSSMSPKKQLQVHSSMRCYRVCEELPRLVAVFILAQIQLS